MRSRFDEQLERLGQELIEMGAMVENAIEKACDALLRQDIELAKIIMSSDPVVDRKERDIESLCLRLLLMQQPVAKDLRLVSSALKMITDMERIGDQAADISEIVTMLGQAPLIKRPDHIREMASATIGMVHKALDAYVSRDLNMAREVIDSDDIVDDLFITVKNELIELLAKDSSVGWQALDLLMIAKYFERIGDHAVNIAEWVEFASTGLYKGEHLQ